MKIHARKALLQNNTNISCRGALFLIFVLSSFMDVNAVGQDSVEEIFNKGLENGLHLELKSDEFTYVLERLSNSDAFIRAEAISALPLFLRGASKDIAPFRERIIGKLKNIVEEDASKLHKPSIGILGALLYSNLNVTDTLKDRIEQLLDSTTVEGKSAFLETIPYFSWRNSQISDRLKSYYRIPELQNEVLDACEAAIELRNCDLDYILLFYCELCDPSYNASRKQFGRMFATIHTWNVMHESQEGRNSAKAMLK